MEYGKVYKTNGRAIKENTSLSVITRCLCNKYGTHFVFPETLIKLLVPGFSKICYEIYFKSAKEHADECRQTRIDIDLKLRKVMREWNNM